MLGMGPHGKNHAVRESMAFRIEQGTFVNERQSLSLERLYPLPNLPRWSNGILKFLKSHSVK